MRTECSVDRCGFGVVSGRDVVARFDGGAMTSDAGALIPISSRPGDSDLMSAT